MSAALQWIPEFPETFIAPNSGRSFVASAIEVAEVAESGQKRCHWLPVEEAPMDVECHFGGYDQDGIWVSRVGIRPTRMNRFLERFRTPVLIVKEWPEGSEPAFYAMLLRGDDVPHALEVLPPRAS